MHIILIFFREQSKMAEKDGRSSSEYVDSIDWYGLSSRTKEELVAKEREVSLKLKELNAIKKILQEERNSVYRNVYTMT